MKLLGKWNWYLPGWRRWLPDAHMEGSARRRPALAAAALRPHAALNSDSLSAACEELATGNLGRL
jgi:hypothetical protein